MAFIAVLVVLSTDPCPFELAGKVQVAVQAFSNLKAGLPAYLSSQNSCKKGGSNTIRQDQFCMGRNLSYPKTGWFKWWSLGLRCWLIPTSGPETHTAAKWQQIHVPRSAIRTALLQLPGNTIRLFHRIEDITALGAKKMGMGSGMVNMLKWIDRYCRHSPSKKRIRPGYTVYGTAWEDHGSWDSSLATWDSIVNRHRLFQEYFECIPLKSQVSPHKVLLQSPVDIWFSVDHCDDVRKAAESKDQEGFTAN